MYRLKTELCGVTLDTPLIAASGTFGFGQEYSQWMDVRAYGAISSKGLTLHPRRGNDGERIYETPSGMMNSIGLENPGVESFVATQAPAMRALGVKVMANLGGHSEEDYVRGAELLAEADIDFLELNISCPNVKSGGMAMGMDPHTAAHITEKVKAVTTVPLLVKLTPAAPDIVAVARAVEAAGADAISLVNTFPALAVDVKRRRPFFDNVYAGLSGPAIRPLALRLVHMVSGAVSVPVVGMGGIETAEDALAFMMAGASCVQIGAANFKDPRTAERVACGLRDYCVAEGLDNIAQIVGALLK